MGGTIATTTTTTKTAKLMGNQLREGVRLSLGHN